MRGDHQYIMTLFTLVVNGSKHYQSPERRLPRFSSRSTLWPHTDGIAPIQVGSIRWFIGLLALGFFVVANFQPAFNATAIWLAGAHGHEHEVVVRAHGNHVDMVLSHRDGQEATEHDHEQPLGLAAAFFSNLDHEGNDHVLHFSNCEVQNQINSRHGISHSPSRQWVLQAASLTEAGPASAKAASAFAAHPPPPLAAGLLCLRATVLLI